MSSCLSLAMTFMASSPTYLVCVRLNMSLSSAGGGWLHQRGRRLPAL